MKKHNIIMVPIWEQYTLTVEEAAAYFRIGENRIREIVTENPNANFYLKMEIGFLLNVNFLNSTLILQRSYKDI